MVQLDNAKKVFFDIEGNFEFKHHEDEEEHQYQIEWRPATYDISFKTLQRLKNMFGADEAYVDKDSEGLVVWFYETLDYSSEAEDMEV